MGQQSKASPWPKAIEPDWSTAYQAFGVAHRDAAATNRVRRAPVAGMTSFEVAYNSAGHEFPRFERQMIRTIHDEGFTSGAKEPHPEMLKHVFDPKQARPGTGFSMRSDATSRQSRGSQASRRSVPSVAGRSIAGSVASSHPPSGYFRQALPPPHLFQTSNSLIGAGGHRPREPQPGREAWMMGRGGGQQSSFDNCLVSKGRADIWKSER